MNVREWLRRLFGDVQPAPAAERPPLGPGAGRRPAVAKPVARTGELLQFCEDAKGRATDVVIGFDFGTSSAKAAIQSPYKLGGRVVFVDFRDFCHPSSRYLLPVHLRRDDERRLSLRRPPSQGEGRTHIKLGLLKDPGGQGDGPTDPAEDMVWASAFIGLALREVRRFFLDTQADNYGADRLRWSLNLGIPSAGYDDTEIRDRFERVARAAWLLSLRSSAPTIETAFEALEQVRQGLRQEVEIAVVPEVAAEVVGYAKSRQRRDGLHLILDVGASTLDLCAFSLHEGDAGEVYSLLTADVQRLGLLDLHWRRMEACGRRPPFDKVPRDLIEPLPNLESASGDATMLLRLRGADDRFVEECARRVLIRTLRDLRQRRDPYSPAWSGSLPLFVTGGGAHSEIVERVIRSADRIAIKSWYPYPGLMRGSLPLPDSLAPHDGVSSAEFLRLAVAFGLSFPAISIGTIEPPGEIPDIERDERPRRWRQAYVDKDQV